MKIHTEWFEVHQSKIGQFIRNIPDYAGSRASTADNPQFVLFEITGLKKTDSRQLRKIKCHLNNEVK